MLVDSRCRPAKCQNESSVAVFGPERQQARELEGFKHWEPTTFIEGKFYGIWN